MQVGLGHRHLVDAPPVHLVCDADRDAVEAGEHVELGEEEVGDAVDTGRVTGDHRVEPAGAPGASGGHPELATDLAQPLAQLVVQFGGEGAGTHPGGVRLEDADDRGDPGGPDAGAGARTASGRVGRGDEGVGAVVDVEQGSLRALEEHGLATVECLVEQQAGVGDAVAEPLATGQHLLDDRVRIECLAVVHLDQHLVLEVQRRLDLLPQDLLVEHVLHPHPDPGELVLVARADAAAGRADLGLAEVTLGNPVDGHVVGHDQVRVGGDQQPAGVNASAFEAVQLRHQHAGIDDDAVADHVGDTGGQDPGRDQVQGEILPVRQHDGVAGVVAALVTHHPLGTAAEQVGRLALAFVTPLGADQDDRRHD